MIESSGQGGHSAQVKMRLLLNGSSIPVAQMGPDFLILKSPFEHLPATRRSNSVSMPANAAGRFDCPTASRAAHAPLRFRERINLMSFVTKTRSSLSNWWSSLKSSA
jgi:hypothetical protein